MKPSLIESILPEYILDYFTIVAKGVKLTEDISGFKKTKVEIPEGMISNIACYYKPEFD